jgi:hypothetical protein
MERTMMAVPEREWTQWTHWHTFILVISAFPLLVLAEHFRPGSGRPATFFFGMIVLAVWWRWELRNRLWFWATVVAVVALHMPLILLVHWTRGWTPAVVAMPFCWVDLLLILRILNLGERLFDS